MRRPVHDVPGGSNSSTTPAQIPSSSLVEFVPCGTPSWMESGVIGNLASLEFASSYGRLTPKPRSVTQACAPLPNLRVATTQPHDSSVTSSNAHVAHSRDFRARRHRGFRLQNESPQSVCRRRCDCGPDRATDNPSCALRVSDKSAKETANALPVISNGPTWSVASPGGPSPTNPFLLGSR
jgi:hypothetical protein